MLDYTMWVESVDRYDFINNPTDETPSITIWFSGCTFNCPGCHNYRLQNRNEDQQISVNRLLSQVIEYAQNVKSIVLLGGEPLQQPNIILFLTKLREILGHGYKIWLYTGYEFADIPIPILNLVDIVKCGKFDNTKLTGGFPSSSNQQLWKYTTGWDKFTIN